MIIRIALLLAVLTAGWSCSSTNPIPLSSAALDGAHAAAAEGKWERAWDLLRDLDSDDLDRATLVDYSKLTAEAAYETGREPAALRYYETYLQLRGPADDSRKAEERVLEIATEMLEGEHRSLWLFPNRWRGRAALQNLAAWSPESPLAPEALARVGEHDFERRRFDEAALDYQMLLSRYAASAWGDLATYRLGACGYQMALDAPTNLELLRSSRNQLDQYLRLFPEGEHVAEARERADALRIMEADYYLGLADYYARIDAPDASARYLRKAEGYDGTPAAAEASARLSRAETAKP